MVKAKFQIHRRLARGSVDPQEVHKGASAVLEPETVPETLGRRAHACFSSPWVKASKGFSQLSMMFPKD